MKKSFCLLCCLVLLFSLFGCKNTDAPANTTVTTESVPPAEVDFSKTDEEMFTDRDKKTEYAESTCVQIQLNGSSALAGDNSVSISGTTVTITKEAT